MEVMVIPESQIILRLLIAAGLGLVIGYERERQDHAAGLRTHMILVVGAALAMTISINVAFILGVEERAGGCAKARDYWLISTIEVEGVRGVDDNELVVWRTMRIIGDVKTRTQIERSAPTVDAIALG